MAFSEGVTPEGHGGEELVVRSSSSNGSNNEVPTAPANGRANGVTIVNTNGVTNGNANGSHSGSEGSKGSRGSKESDESEGSKEQEEPPISVALDQLDKLEAKFAEFWKKHIKDGFKQAKRNFEMETALKQANERIQTLEEELARNAAEATTKIAALSDRMDSIDSLEDRERRSEAIHTALTDNRDIREANEAHFKRNQRSITYPLRPLYNPVDNRPIPGFPTTVREMLMLGGEQASDILNLLGYPMTCERMEFAVWRMRKFLCALWGVTWVPELLSAQEMMLGQAGAYVHNAVQYGSYYGTNYGTHGVGQIARYTIPSIVVQPPNTPTNGFWHGAQGPRP